MAVKHHITLEREFDEYDTLETMYLVALDDVLPVATCRLIPTDETSMTVGRIVVLPEYRNHGLGSRIVMEAERWAAELGYRKVVLDSRVNKLVFMKNLDMWQIWDISFMVIPLIVCIWKRCYGEIVSLVFFIYRICLIYEVGYESDS